ncbi:type II toxin-antitoxin system RelE/ParE family toxin [bacterium]|nr:type II toxin-antitoxin system RelE/ParE family toxin [Bacteroidales bacterium]MCK5685139.1 type II toxin-antitoxin system RelE/ParE family toxin [bacterium]
MSSCYYDPTQEEYDLLQDALELKPRSGDVIKGAGGVRKLRWTQKKRGKGKRGGTRVIYYYVDARGMIVLIAIYSKNEAEDISQEDKKVFKKLTAKIDNMKNSE